VKRNNSAPPRTPAKITNQQVERSAEREQSYVEVRPYEPLPGVVPKDKVQSAMAMDSTPYEVINQLPLNAEYGCFRGYPVLAAMAQQVEYSNMVRVMADEMVRNWIEVKSTEAGDEYVEMMEDALVKYDIKRLIHKAVEHDATFGVAHIFADVGASEEELTRPLVLDKRVIKKGDEISFRCVDPTWVYPATYNTLYPLRADFYKPSQWFVMGQTVHESRFIDIVSRPVQQILKPSYNFGGLSLIQLMESYVCDWRDVKRNVSAIIRTIRMRALKTDMDARLQEPGEFDKRIKLFTNYQENSGIWAIDTSEDLLHQQTSLSDLSSLLSNYQDQLCIPARVTNLKLLGNAPAGLNASGDSELETWHETISGMQESDIRRALENIFKIIQLAEFGEIKPEIYFEFRPLNELSDKEKAEINEIKVRTIATAADSMMINSDESRDALREIQGGGFENLGEGYEPEETEEV
jgi:phage-related protein (TIGR01555 family)